MDELWQKSAKSPIEIDGRGADTAYISGIDISLLLLTLQPFSLIDVQGHLLSST